RDMFYNGNPQPEPGAVVMRVSPSFLRFGNYEILAARKEIENLQNLIDWTISRYYPHISGENKILGWFKEVVARTAKLMVEWMRVGFVHGVMNTDNMSILGLTIDYGPFSFLDDYDPNFTPNTTDLPGRRYAFGKQAEIAQWNLGCLAGALLPVFPEKEKLVAALEEYGEIFWGEFYTMMAGKLGLDKLQQQDLELINSFRKTLAELKPDYTIFFQLLMGLPPEPENEQQVMEHFADSFYQEPEAAQREQLYKLMQDYAGRIKSNTITKEQSRQRMQEHNPRFILRNYLLHEAIQELERGENQLFLKLQEAIKNPYSKQFDEFFKKRPEWARQQSGCSMLSCSS
ncbi:MAG: protein adenylyltransferase SelO family protein, partial [Hymenobacteraceae bacterium]|nr:protein adenylyltransferase SelO family protein [Hymenobacteraceae bacterium]MDX5513972.1 protein adenylyltransferase SelO family protein [Hymenobacteraceae bacterium]